MAGMYGAQPVAGPVAVTRRTDWFLHGGDEASRMPERVVGSRPVGSGNPTCTVFVVKELRRLVEEVSQPCTCRVVRHRDVFD